MMVKLVLLFGLAASMLLAACGGQSELDGTVDHKTITGVLDNVSYTILRYQPAFEEDGAGAGPTLNITDSEFVGVFSTGDDYTIINVS